MEEVVHLDPRHIRAYMQLAEVRLRQAQLAEGQERLERTRDAAVAMNIAAWFMATNVEDGLRNGPDAVNLASRAVQLAGPAPGFLDTLAAAWAEAGDFAKAAAIAKQAADAEEQIAAKEAAEGRADRAAGARNLPRPSASDCASIEQRQPYRDTRIGVGARVLGK